MTFVLAVVGALANATASVLQPKVGGEERTGPWIGGLILGPLVIVAGMVLLLRSPYLQGEAGRSEGWSPGQATGESSGGC